MTLRVVGAGLCRTGTLSQKVALERLLDAPCHHMTEVFEHPEQVAHWQELADGGEPDWDALLGGYAAAVDLPAAFAWRELAARYPDAPVVLSTRSSPEAWWRSTDATVLAARRRGIAEGMGDTPFGRMIDTLFRTRLCATPDDPGAMQAAYVAHNDAVRAAVPAERLVEWQPGDGWGPICDALGVPTPDEPFPEVNSTREFRAAAGLD